MDRLTYKSSFGDYGGAKDFPETYLEICALRNKLGKFEDDDWRSIKNDGLPKKEGIYNVTSVAANGRRYAFLCVFDGVRFDALSNVIAWRPQLEPYQGD